MSKIGKWVIGVIVIVLIVWGIAGSKKTDTKSLVIGALYPLSGPATYYGESGKRGVDLAIKQARKENKNLDIQVFVEDNAFNPKIGVDAYNKLKFGHKLDAVITQTSPVAVAVQPLANEDRILQMAFSASADGYTSPDDLSFRTTGGTLLEVEPMVGFIQDNYGKVAVLYMNNEIGTSIAKTFTSEIQKTNAVTITSNESFPLETTDFRTIISKIKSSQSDAIYFAGLASHTVSFLKQMEELKLDLPIFAFRTAEDPVLISNAGTLAEKVIFTSAFDANDNAEVIRDFVDDFNSEYGIVPDNYAAEGYFAGRLVIEVMEECSKESKCIFDYLSTLKYYPSIFGNVNFDRNGNVSYPFFLKTIRDGKFVKFLQ